MTEHTSYPDPTPEMLANDPLFDAIWNAIKGWDISRHNDGMYSGPTGNDARHIYDAIKHLHDVPQTPVTNHSSYNSFAHEARDDLALPEPNGMDNLKAILADQPYRNSGLSVHEIEVILANEGGFMPDEAVLWFRAARGNLGSVSPSNDLPTQPQTAPELPPAKEIEALVGDFTDPDWDTKTAFASHRRTWIVQCLSAVLSQINAAPAAATELTCEFAQMLPGGKLDDSTYEKIETALDRAEAPCTKDGKWLSLHERIAALAEARPQQSTVSDLAETIRTKLLGVPAADQDVVLEDADWRMILAALSTTRS